MSAATFFNMVNAVAQRVLAVIALVAIAAGAVLMEGCAVYRGHPNIDGRRQRTVAMEVTGYDSGPGSCNWTRDRRGRPVIASGPNKGKPKIIGQTASGGIAKKGTIAADTSYYPFGTIMYVPGYGWGTVEDRGGDIKGPNRLDLWFSSEREARKWGRRKNVRVTVYLPER